MKKAGANTVIFSIGACGYGLIEVVWRGYTHWSMLGAGGLSFLGLSVISRAMKKCSLIKKAIAGSVIITAIEFIFGIIFNVILKKNVWNYSRMPFNIGGQVCALYSFFWVILSMVFMPVADRLNLKLQKKL